MRDLIGIVAALSFSLAAGTATAGRVQEAAKAARDERLGRYSPMMGFQAEDAFGRWWSVVTIYVVFDPPARAGTPPDRRWVARQLRGEAKGQTTETWTDTRSCPALTDVLGAASALPVDSIRTPHASMTPPPARYTADGVRYTVWSSAGVQPLGDRLEVQISGNSGALADWGDSAYRLLETCWKPDRPAL